MEMMKMRQAVMTEPKTIDFREADVPVIQSDQVLVRIMKIGVCGSDMHVYHGVHPYTSYPVVQGHEVSGIVEKTGSNVTDFSRGDKVTIEPQVSCGTCYPCTHGNYNICDSLKVLGFQTTGTASDYFAVPAEKLVILPMNMDYSFGAMIEPLSVAVRAVKRAGHVQGTKVLVYGAGPIGNLVAQTVKAEGAESVIIVDINQFRLEKALECGIDYAVNPTKSKIESEINNRFGPYEKADLIFECAGALPTIESAINVARKGSSIIAVGVFGEKVPVDMALVNDAELTIIGTARYVIEDFRHAIQLVQDGRVNLNPLVTHRFDFQDYLKAYQQIENSGDETMKVIISVNEE
jgi:L-iditol 2-dehydrogenase